MPEQLTAPTDTKQTAEPARAQEPAAEHKAPVSDLSEHTGAYSYFRSIAQSSAGREPPPERFSPIFASSDYANPANDSQRERVLGSMQQLYGNRYVQRMLTSIGRSGGKPEGGAASAGSAKHGNSPDPHQSAHGTGPVAGNSADTHSSAPVQRQLAGSAVAPGANGNGKQSSEPPIEKQVAAFAPSAPAAPSGNGDGAHAANSGQSAGAMGNGNGNGNGAHGAELPMQRQAAAFAQSAPAAPPADGNGAPPPLQRQASGSQTPAAAPSLEGSTGHPLDSGTRAFMEPVVGQDLGQVRIHTDPPAGQAAQDLSANAFTTGNDIYFAPGQYNPSDTTGRGLVAHELTHVVQQNQGSVSPGISQPGDAHEVQAEAVQSAVVSGGGAAQMQAVPAAPAVMPSVQRDDADDSAPGGILGKFLNFISDKVSLIPGFRLFTLIIGVNPITMSSVDRSPANLIRALVEIAPGGTLITQALDNYGVIDKVGAFVTQQFQTLGLAADSILKAIKDFGSSLGLSDLLHLGALWDRAKAIFTEPVVRIKNFVVGLVTGILGLIKDAILMPLAKLAEGTRGWDLLIAVLGKNPITGDPVPRTAETLIGGFMKLIGEEETWNNIKKANALPRAWAWFQGALAGLLGFVTQIPTLFINTLKSLTLEDVVIITNAFAKVAGVFGNFIGSFIKWAGDALWQLLQIIFEVLAPAAIPYLKKVGAAFKTILKNPIAFVGNLVAAGKLGFQQFASNIGTHLKDSFIQWLTGNLEGVYIPRSLDISEIVKFVLSVLGISWQNIRQKLVKVVGEPAVKAMETGFEIVVTLVTKGPAAAWEQIKEQLSNLKDMVMQGIISFLTETVVKKAVEKVVGMLIPGAAFIEAIISIYNTVEVFLQKLQKIIQVAVAFLDSMMEIASGAIGNAANKVENTLAGLLTLAISFLAGFLGLGDIAAKVMDIINTKVRQPIDKALDAVINWIVTMAKKLFAKAFGKDKKDEKDDRTDEQKQADLDKAIAEAEALQQAPKATDDGIKKGLLSIKAKYKMASLELVVDTQDESKETAHVEGEINPKGKSKEAVIQKIAGDLNPEEFYDESLWMELASRTNAGEVPVGEGIKISASSLSWNSKVLLDLIDKSDGTESDKAAAQASVASNLMAASQSTNEKEIYRSVQVACRAVNNLYKAEIASVPGAQLQAHHRPGVSASSPAFPETRAGRLRASIANRIQNNVANLKPEEKAIGLRPASERPALIREYVQQLLDVEIQSKVEKSTGPLEEFDLDVLTADVHLGQVHARK
jgi:predicted secreted protein